MIIEFSAENFRSIKDRQTLSLKGENYGGHLRANMVAGPAAFKSSILKTLGVYGANASGKSTLLLAILALQFVVTRSGNLKSGEAIECYEPHMLCKRSRTRPVTFSLDFVATNGLRYRYRVSYTRNEIVEERLTVFASARESVVFQRSVHDTWETVRFGSRYKGGTRRVPFFPNNAYLSKAGNNAGAPQVVREAFDYIRNEIVHLAVDERVAFAPDIHKGMLGTISQLLRLIDTGVDEVELHERDVKPDDFKFPSGMPKEMKDHMLASMKQRFLFAHRDDSGNLQRFEKVMESAGTTKMFDLAPLIIDALRSGGTLIIDELDNSMHPFMAELITKLFNDPTVNPGRAQLIFTTHNINLMSPDNFRRDQIWFAEKSKGISRFYSLDDFDKRKVTPTSPFNLWYAQGRFGAVPRIDYESIAALFRKEAKNA